MADDLTTSSDASDQPKETDAIPRAFVAAAGHLLALDFLLDFLLGLISTVHSSRT